MKVLRLLYILLTLIVSVPLWAAEAAGITHVQGLSGRELLDNGMQGVHTYERTIYMKSGDQQILYRPDATTYQEYVRWYDYQSDTRAAEVTGNTAANYDLSSGLYYTGNTGGVTFTAPANFTSTNYPNGIDIACDQSSYKGYSATLTGKPGGGLKVSSQEIYYMVERTGNGTGTKLTADDINNMVVGTTRGNIGIWHPTRAPEGYALKVNGTNPIQGTDLTGNDDAFYFDKSINWRFGGGIGSITLLTITRVAEGFTLSWQANSTTYYVRWDGSCLRGTTNAGEKTIFTAEAWTTELTDASQIPCWSNYSANGIMLRMGDNYLSSHNTDLTSGATRNLAITAKTLENYKDTPEPTYDITEPTLSQRLLFHIKPANEMSDRLAGKICEIPEATFPDGVNNDDLTWWLRRSSDKSLVQPGEVTDNMQVNIFSMTFQLAHTGVDAWNGYSGIITEAGINGTGWYVVPNSLFQLQAVDGGYKIKSINTPQVNDSKAFIKVNGTSNCAWSDETNASIFIFEALPGSSSIYKMALRTKDGFYLKYNHNNTTREFYNVKGILGQAGVLASSALTDDSQWLETEHLMAPAGVNVYEGPALQWKSGSDFDYSGHTYYFNKDGIPTACTTANGTWQWRNDGVVFNPAEVMTGRFIQLPTAAAGETHIYTLQYIPTGSTRAYNICKIEVDYISRDDIGPSSTLGYKAVDNAELKAKQDFNYPLAPYATITRDGHNIRYCTDPVPFEESAYGFYYGVPAAQHTGGGNGRNYPYWGEYGIQSYASSGWGIGYNLANHYETSDDVFGMDENQGYMLYVDGSQIPGEVFELDVNGLRLCANSKMYCSAWVSSVTAKGSTPPCLDFEVIAKNITTGREKVIITYTTGEISNDDLGGSGTNGRWRHILFPVIYRGEVGSAAEGDVQFRVRIVNKGKNASGNDFAIDDIAFYAKHANFKGIQATTTSCLQTGESTVMPLYLRVDYELLVAEEGEHTYYYSWFDSSNESVTGQNYFWGGDLPTGEETTAGAISKIGKLILTDDLTDKPTYDSFKEFDAFISNEVANDRLVAQRAYVWEMGLDGRERYFLYIVQPLEVEANRTYTVKMANDIDEFATDNECLLKAKLDIIAGARIRVDGEVFTHETSVCGNHSYTLDIQMKYILQDDETGEYVVHSLKCNADWLQGNKEIILSNKVLYGIDNVVGNKAAYNVGDIDDNDEAAFRALVLAIYVSNGIQGEYTDEYRAIIQTLTDNGLLQKDKTSLLVVPTYNNKNYLAFPKATEEQIISGESTHICPEPQDIFFDIPDNYGHGVVIGGAANDMPNDILNSISKIRVLHSDAQLASEVIFPLYQIADLAGFVILGAESVEVDDEGNSLITLDAQMYDNPDPAIRNQVAQVPQSGCYVVLTGDAFATMGVGSHVFSLNMTVPQKDGGGNDLSECSIRHAIFSLEIIPDVVTLKKGATVWNSDESWVEGYAPLPGTSVVLPAKAVTIPTADQVLNVSKGEQLIDVRYETGAQDYITYDVNYVPFACKDIYLPVGACLMNQTQLTIGGKAYIDVPFTANKWQLASFPIQGVVSGDIFIPQSENSGATHPFSVKEMTTPADRYLHPFYHNLYNASVVNTTGSGSCEETVTSSTWLTNTTAAGAESGNTANGTTIPYGYVAGGYNAAALWLDEAATGASGAANGIVRLPKKADATYSYYDKNTHEWIGYLSESVTRSGDSNYGKPAYTNGNGQTFTLRGNTAGTVFLFGNPTLAYIDMGKFMTANSSTLTGTVHRYDGTNNQYIAYHDIGADASPHCYLPPYSAVLVEKKGGAATEVNVTISNAMLSAATPGAPASVSQRNSVQSAEPPVQNTIFITAQSGEFTTYAAAIEGEGSNLYDEEEDAEVFLMAPEQTPFTIYTTADNHALAINRHANLDYLPVCLYSNEPAMQGLKQTTYLTFSGDNAYLAEWDLVMLGTTKKAALKDGLKVKIGLATDGTPNIALQHTRRPITTSVDNTEAHALHAFAHQGTILVYADLPIGELQIYTPSGQLIYQKQNVGTMHEIQLPEAVYVLRANGQAIKLLNY